MRVPRAAVALLMAILLVAGCGNDGDAPSGWVASGGEEVAGQVVRKCLGDECADPVLPAGFPATPLEVEVGDPLNFRFSREPLSLDRSFLSPHYEPPVDFALGLPKGNPTELTPDVQIDPGPHWLELEVDFSDLRVVYRFPLEIR